MAGTLDDEVEECIEPFECLELGFKEGYFPDEDYSWIEETIDIIDEYGGYFASEDQVKKAYDAVNAFVKAYNEIN